MCDCSPAPEFFEEKIVRAQKEYKCCECRQPILVGEPYRRCTGVWDKEFQIFRCCQACVVLWTSLVAEGVHCICFTELHEHVAESWV